ncbi:[4Fe-4S] proteins maturation [Dipsacomyces acuminosporus]|nr:[4Fe-4S] proteins maturation [Dipsacomyces acuminosporus]
MQRPLLLNYSRYYSTAKYNLRKLGSNETADLENKINTYAQSQLGSSNVNKAQVQSEAAAEKTSTAAAAAAAAAGSEADEIALTDSAIDRLKYLSKERKKTQYLRLRVDSGGCYGFSYMLDMTEEPEENDIIIDRNGAKMVIDDVSLPLVRGATIDWQDRLIGQAFLVVANPQSSGGCGCGASFEIKLD